MPNPLPPSNRELINQLITQSDTKLDELDAKIFGRATHKIDHRTPYLKDNLTSAQPRGKKIQDRKVTDKEFEPIIRYFTNRITRLEEHLNNSVSADNMPKGKGINRPSTTTLQQHVIRTVPADNAPPNINHPSTSKKTPLNRPQPKKNLDERKIIPAQGSIIVGKRPLSSSAGLPPLPAKKAKSSIAPEDSSPPYANKAPETSTLFTGDSLVRHKIRHVQLLDPKGTSSFANRNEKLKEVERLKVPARRASEFEKNNDCQRFLNFLNRPESEYRLMRSNKTLRIPNTEKDGNIQFKSINIDERVEEKIKHEHKARRNIKKSAAIKAVAEELKTESQLLKQYYNDKKARETRESIINDLTNNKEEYQQDIEQARLNAQNALIQNSNLMTDLQTRYPDIYDAWEQSDKKKSLFEYFLNALETKRNEFNKELQKATKKPLRKQLLDSAQAFFSGKSARIALKAKKAELEKNQAQITFKISKLNVDIANLGILKVKMHAINHAASSMTKDLTYSITRKDNPEGN
ncbi:MAG: hypothetical protein PUP46_01550 [Endozoicomonas sp. (ex Botrylloides leachii)]|nr:hypothetical protein [Endozoicomonas sp. (ex Botrylloides leachii)]